MIPAERLRELKEAGLDDIYNAVKGKAGAPNKIDIPTDFHQQYVHGDKIGTGNPGGRWNDWWSNQVKEFGGIENMNANDWLSTKAKSFDYIMQLWKEW